ncbi:MAG: hypothetical protein CML23_19570 [Rhizobiaceae bacterium]|nr:hypothetical protein [Rhizobiaceae bacterium]
MPFPSSIRMKPMADQPKDIFNNASSPDQDPIRDKDNASPQHKPSFSRRPPPNLAPPGFSGIRRGLPTPTDQQAKRFSAGVPGNLKAEFKRIAAPEKGHDHDL